MILPARRPFRSPGGRVTADAADLAPLGGESVWVNGVQIYGGAESGSVEGASYDPATNTLTLDGAYITKAYDCEEESCVAGIYSSGNLNIKLVGTNTIVGGSDMSDGINVLGRLTIDGPGSLDILLENEIDGLTAIAGWLSVSQRLYPEPDLQKHHLRGVRSVHPIRCEPQR